jgi:hypothetical protein
MSETKKTERMKPMIITDPDTGHEYTLEFTRASVRKCEAAGLDINLAASKSMTMIPLLFWGAFQAHHKNIKQEATDKILFDGLGGLNDQELEYLAGLYAEPFKSLIADDEVETANPRKMTVTF